MDGTPPKLPRQVSGVPEIVSPQLRPADRAPSDYMSGVPSRQSTDAPWGFFTEVPDLFSPVPEQGMMTPYARGLILPELPLPNYDEGSKKLLGSGGLGRAYLVRYGKQGRKFVIKELNTTQIAAKKRGESGPSIETVAHEVRKLEVEMKALNHVGRHPNLVGFMGSKLIPPTDLTPGSLQIALTHVEGQSLTHQLGKMSQTDARHVIAQVLTALDYCHARGVAHQDVKPDNILVDKKGHATLIDFGEARFFPPGNPNIASERMPPGTPGFTGKSDSVVARDMYAVGKTLELMLKKPVSPQAKEVINSCLKGEMPISDLLKHPWFTDVETSTT